MAKILLALYFVVLIENPRQYTKYSFRFSASLPKILTAQSAHKNCAVLPYAFRASSIRWYSGWAMASISAS